MNQDEIYNILSAIAPNFIDVEQVETEDLYENLVRKQQDIFYNGFMRQYLEHLHSYQTDFQKDVITEASFNFLVKAMLRLIKDHIPQEKINDMADVINRAILSLRVSDENE